MHLKGRIIIANHRGHKMIGTEVPFISLEQSNTGVMTPLTSQGSNFPSKIQIHISNSPKIPSTPLLNPRPTLSHLTFSLMH